MIKRLKTSKGITLIALVITIIVLLILAGIAISMLSGENGILNKSTTAKTHTEKASAEEAIKLAAMSALAAGNGKIEGTEAFKTLNNELKDAGYNIGEIKELPVIVKVNGKDYEIQEDGIVKEQEPIDITIASLIKSGEPITQEKLTLEDKKGYKITIPKNFKISAESPELVIEGMIIEDSEDNQYVWIPVFTKEQEPEWGADFSEVATKTEDSDEYYEAIKKALIDTKTGYTKAYRNSSYNDVWYGDENYGQCGYYAKEDTTKENLIYYTNGNMTEKEYNNLYKNMLKSVYLNGGFYIGRYEMGITRINNNTEAKTNSRTYEKKEYKASSSNSTNQAPTIEGMKIPVSKANAVGYNFIRQIQAQMLARELGKKLDYINVESSIMFGVQWDAVCVFLEHYGKIDNSANTNAGEKFASSYLTSNDHGKYWGNYLNSTFKLDSGYYTTATDYSLTITWIENYTTLKGASSRWLCTTGASNQNSCLNIYDFAGNLSEWTLERYSKSSNPCVNRGSNCGSKENVSNRSNSSTTSAFIDNSSRVSLYIK